MIELRAEHDYVIGDTNEWLEDVSQPHDDAQASFDAFREREDAAYYAGDDVRPWLDTLHDGSLRAHADDGDWPEGAARPTGIYGDGPPATECTANVDNWLSDDLVVTLAHTAEFGDLLIWQRGIWSSAEVHVSAFTGDDDADAFSYSSGYAGHADGSECDSEWILESACVLWRNGGSDAPKLWELARDDDDRMLCPDHNVPLAFMGG